ncbi:Formamidopyrimidine-DNA glycosylase [Novipirellula aureliae]|uniref:Formamidopyrimidine-DNA glycosylase n=1 Tax=Novipirellula aureliae TaxID=2527966 RepID=A0A5C6EAP4_9BACT|nr:bifunctional DNA-formamidopyrimidine glycosylase/DNA-(apurinic or apyrimidinic site) lyase [Novipirellula aureliae]TWU45938.1 Formamidopyrimidine-DNA glycosylase [Novipirellula aureliae]
MPELPEVETMRRGILPIIGCKIESVVCPRCERKPILLSPAIEEFDRRLRGKQVVGIGRRGKRVLVEVEEEQAIVIEPRMTGLVLLADPPTREHLRLQINLNSGPNQSVSHPKRQGGQLLFWDRRGLGTVRLLTHKEIREQIDIKLGTDALEITADGLRDRLRKSQRAIKVALLDQSAVAGVGNLYAAELLFRAGIDPRTRCDRLSGPQWKRIVCAMQHVLNEAILYEGSTLSDGTYRNAINGEGSYQAHHLVYDRAQTPCPRCEEGTIQRIVQAQRSTFFCPICQRKRGLHPTLASRR